MKKQIVIISLTLLLAASLTACGMSEEAKAAQALMDALPSGYSTEIDRQLAEAKEAYEALSDEDKEAVDAAAMEALLAEMQEQKAVEINALIAEYAVASDTVKAAESLTELYEAADAYDGDRSQLELAQLHEFHKKTVDNWQKERNKVEETFDAIVVVSDHLMTNLHLIVTNPEQYHQTAYADECDAMESALPKLENYWSTAEVNKLDETMQLGNVAHLAFAISYIRGETYDAETYRAQMKSYTTEAQNMFYDWWTTDFAAAADEVEEAGNALNSLLDDYPDLVPEDVTKVDNSELKG